MQLRTRAMALQVGVRAAMAVQVAMATAITASMPATRPLHVTHAGCGGPKTPAQLTKSLE